jgi:murein DD-endopeptidase MepM/ murein hydrolase activator NlpD
LSSSETPALTPFSAAFNLFRARGWLFAGLTFPLVAAAVAYQTTRPTAVSAPLPLDLTALAAVAESTTTATTEDGPASIEITVRRNDTLDRIFRTASLDLGTLAELRRRPEVRKALDLLRPGENITLTHQHGALLSLNRQVSDTSTLSISREGDAFAVNYIENPLETEIIGHRARIETSLFEAGKQAGISAPVIMTLANDIFGWDVDFALDIRAGDEFSVLYERRFQDGSYVGDGRVLAAEFVNSGKKHRAVWFESADGKVFGYFTPDGSGMRKAFLRSPLDFTRITSHFNPRRRHPISGRIRAHTGVDYGAPSGTPIKASGNGRVQFAGRKGGYGNAVIIDHGNGITTLYGHMSRFSRNARGGHKVAQGEVIGYVGSTGASTGPHLHYEYRVRGVHKNPAKVVMPRAELPPSYLAEFRAQADILLAQMNLVAPAANAQVYAANTR